MTVTLDTTLYVVIGMFVGLLIALIIAYILLINKYRKLLEKYYTNERLYLRKFNQVSMIEYHYRNFKEGKNAFTVLRDIGDIITRDIEVGDVDGE